MVEPVSATPIPDSAAFKAPPVDLRPFEAPEELFQTAPEPPKESQAQQQPDRKSVEGQVEAINSIMRGLGHRLEFGLFQDSDQLFVKVVDRRNNQVVKVIPPEEFLALRQKIADAVGILLDDQL